jgi:hypothetical protein
MIQPQRSSLGAFVQAILFPQFLAQFRVRFVFRSLSQLTRNNVIVGTTGNALWGRITGSVVAIADGSGSAPTAVFSAAGVLLILLIQTKAGAGDTAATGAALALLTGHPSGA